MSLQVWPQTDGAALVRTPHLKAVQQLVGEVVSERDVMAVGGAPGMGKTVAIETALAEAGVSVLRLVMPQRLKGKQLIVETLRGCGQHPNPARPEWMLLADLEELLDDEDNQPAQGPRAILVDEVKSIGVEGLRTFHFLRERRRPPKWSLFLVGTDIEEELAAVPALNSRTWRRVHFDAWPKEAVVSNLRAYHPLFDQIDARLLLKLDDEAYRGNFRAWDGFLRGLLQRLSANYSGPIDAGRLTALKVAQFGTRRTRRAA